MARKVSGLAKIDGAAVRVIGRRGFARASTRQIAHAAGVSEGLIFRYYKTKLDLGRRLFQRHYHDVLSLLKAEAARHADPLVTLGEVAKTFYRWFDEDRDIGQFLLRSHQEFLETVDEDQGILWLAGRALRGILGEAVFGLLPGDILAAMVVGAFVQVATECMHGQVKGPLGPRMAPVIDSLVGFLKERGQAPFPAGEGA